MWTIYVGGGPRRVNHAAVALGEKVYSFGGYCSGETMTNSQPIDVHELNTNNFRWRQVKPVNKQFLNADETFQEPENFGHVEMTGDDKKLSEEYLNRLAVPYQRYGHTVVEYRGKAYLWGGRNDEFGASAHLHEFDPVKCKWRYVETGWYRPPARDGHTAVIINDKMFLFGGFEEEAQRFSQETYYFDFNLSTWFSFSTMGDPPLWRDFHTAVAMDGKMYVFGGRSDQMGQYHSTRDTYCNNLKVLDVRTKTWTLLQPQGARPLGRRSHSAWAYNGRMYMFGGFNGTMNKHYDELWCYDPHVNRWEQMRPKALAQPPCARRRQCTVVVGTRVFLFGGTTPTEPTPTNPGLTDLADLYVFDYSPSLGTFASRVFINSGFFDRCPELLTAPVRMELQYMTEPNKVGSEHPNTRALMNG